MQQASRQPSQRARRTSPTTGGWIGLIVLFFLAGVGAIAAIAAVGAYSALAKSADLKPPTDMDKTVLAEESIIYDRTGKVELARFGDAKRDIVTFDEIPPVIIDATTAVEDKTFWENAGFDPVAIISAGLDSLRGNGRGASTITQQLVRARLLAPELVQDPDRTAERKLKEIIQSIRVTQEFQGVEGKKAIITAYLNQNYYGNQSYGVKAAYENYFGKAFTVENVTPAEAAIIAALPKSPSNYDLVRNAIEVCTTVVGEDEDCPEVAARRPRRHDDRPAPQRHPRPAGPRRPDADLGRPVLQRGLHRRPRATPSSSRARRPRAGSPRISSGRCATSSPTELCGPDAGHVR